MNRKNIILKNVSLGVIYKLLNMGIVFITIPMLLNYLDQELYGIWVTIFSVINIVFFVDIGVANGLKTKLTQAISDNNKPLARAYITNAYFFILVLAFLFLILGSLIIYFINLNEILNIPLTRYELNKVFFATLILVVLGFSLSLYKAFYYAIQKSFVVELSLLIFQFIVLVGIFIFSSFTTKSLFYIALIYGCSNVIMSIFFTIKFFKSRRDLRPSFKLLKLGIGKDLMDLSVGFFIIQLCMIVIFATDNVLISSLLSPKDVTHYDVVLKLFQASIILSVIAQDPFWPLYTDAYQKQQFNWIKQTILRLNKLFLLFVLFIVVLIFISKAIIGVWIPQKLEISFELIVFMGVFVVVRVYGIIYMNFLNAVGKIKLQVLLFVLGAIVNVPLSIFFVKKMQFGTSGIILGTVLSIVALSVVLPIQTFRILKNS